MISSITQYQTKEVDMINLMAVSAIVLFVLIGILFAMIIIDSIKYNGGNWFVIIFCIVIWLIFGLRTWLIVSIAIQFT